MGGMDFFWDAAGFVLALAALAFVFGGAGMGWSSFFQLRRLKEELEALRRQDQTSAPPPARIIETPPPAPVTPAPEVILPPQASPPVNRPPSNLPPRVPGWEKKFLENWTGLVGLAVITLGLGFLAAWAATVVPPFGRFLLIVAGSALLMAAGLTLPRTRPRWTRWGYWLQSLAAAVFLIGCLGSGGIPGVAWVENPLAALGLLVLGVAVNLVLGSMRRRQPYLTLHAVLSLVALSVPGPAPVLLLFLTATAFAGVALAWFQKWTYNRAVVALVFQGILVLSRFRVADPDPGFSVWFVVASAAIAALVHVASYRRLEQGAPGSRAAVVTHVANAVAAGLACAVWAPRSPLLTVIVLGTLVLVLAVLASLARKTGTSWLYRTDRVLALAVAALVLLLNPLGGLPLVLASGFALIVLVFAWTAFREGDDGLTRISDIAVFGTFALLPVAALVFQIDAAPEAWTWGVASCFVAASAAMVYFRFRGAAGPWPSWTLALVPATFAFPLVALLGSPSPFPGVSPGWFLLVPWAALTALLRRDKSAVSVGGLAVVGGVASLAAWVAAAWPLGFGAANPADTLLWGTPLVLVMVAPLLAGLGPRRPVFTAAFLAAVAGLGVWTASSAWVSPALPPAVWAAWMVVVLAVRRPLEGLDPRLPRFSLWLLAGGLAIARLAVWTGPVGPLGVVDGAVVALMVLLAVLRSTGPGPFWELALAWGLGFFWTDLPREAFGLMVALLAVGGLAASRYSTRAKRLAWYSVALFLAANVLAVFADDLGIKAATLAALVVYLVLDSLVPGRGDTPLRRYALVLVQGVALAVALPAFLAPQTLTLGWSLEAALLFLLAVVWKDALFKNAAFLGLAACLARLLLVDLSNSDVLTKAITFLSVGALMVGMNVLYLWSKNR